MKLGNYSALVWELLNYWNMLVSNNNTEEGCFPYFLVTFPNNHQLDAFLFFLPCNLSPLMTEVFATHCWTSDLFFSTFLSPNLSFISLEYLQVTNLSVHSKWFFSFQLRVHHSCWQSLWDTSLNERFDINVNILWKVANNNQCNEPRLFI